MLLNPGAVRRMAPSAMSGASGLYIIMRCWRLSRAPARIVSLPRFLFMHADLIGVVCGYPILMLVLGRQANLRESLDRVSATATSTTTLLGQSIHELRQTFTALMLGLGLIERRARAGRTVEVTLMVRRLIRILDDGMSTVRSLESAQESLRMLLRIDPPNQ